MINVAEIVDRLGPTEATSVIMDALQKGDYIDIDMYDEWLETFEECGPYLLLDTPLGLLAGTIQYWTGIARGRLVFSNPFDPPPSLPPSPPKRVIDQFAR